VRPAVFLENIVGAKSVDILLLRLSNYSRNQLAMSPTVLINRPSMSKIHARTGGKLLERPLASLLSKNAERILCPLLFHV